MGKAIKIGNRDNIIHRMKLMLNMIKSCPKDATFQFNYEIVQIDKDFMKKAEKFNQEYRTWEQKVAQVELDEEIKKIKKEKKEEGNI